MEDGFPDETVDIAFFTGIIGTVLVVVLPAVYAYYSSKKRSVSSLVKSAVGRNKSGAESAPLAKPTAQRSAPSPSSRSSGQGVAPKSSPSPSPSPSNGVLPRSSPTNSQVPSSASSATSAASESKNSEWTADDETTLVKLVNKNPGGVRKYVAVCWFYGNWING